MVRRCCNHFAFLVFKENIKYIVTKPILSLLHTVCFEQMFSFLIGWVWKLHKNILEYTVNIFYFILPNLKKWSPHCKPYFNESTWNFVLCAHAGEQCVWMKMYPATYLIRAIYWYWQVNFNIWYRNGFNVFFRGFIVVDVQSAFYKV